MPLSEAPKSKENAKPFKSVDIKSLFLAAGNRKRKASSSISSSNETKSVKLCEKESDHDVEVIDVTENSDVISAGDSKENKDLNTVEIEQINPVNGITPSKETDVESLHKLNVSSATCEDDSKGSSEDLNSSLNSSVLVPNTSDLSDNNQSNAETVNTTSNTETVKSETKSNVNEKMLTNDTKPRKRKRMTPEEAQQRANEREQKQKEKLLKKQEFEAKRQKREEEIKQRKLAKEIEKKAKEMERKAKEEEKKEKERLRLEKKQQEEKEKEAQKMLRQMQLAQKLELKKQKEEMKQKQEEERKRAEEEKKKADLEKEEKERLKKERAKAAFVKFFVKENTAPPPPSQKTEQKEGFFKPFQISEDMTLAPVVPSIAQKRFNREKLDAALKSQDDKTLYLQLLKSDKYHDVRYRKRQRKPKLCDADVIIADKNSETSLHLTAKLLQFSENVRPPYWGTWRKKSRNIRPRNPFGQDDLFDYSVDSDDEWDEGGPGESLSGTENEDESEDDYEVDNEFFVPHGYLSAEEEKEDDEEEKEVVNDPEKQKALLKKKQQEFEMERKKKTTELKPIILGCYIENIDSPQNNELRTLLEPYIAVFLTESPIPTSLTVKKQNESKPNSAVSSPNVNANNAKKVPEEAMPHLIRLMHGNSHGRAILIPEFQKFWKQHCETHDQSEKKSDENKAVDLLEPGTSAVPESALSDSFISKRQLVLTMKQIATKRTTEATKNLAWWVNDSVREKYGLTDMTLPNAWNYITSINKEKMGGEEVQEEEKMKKTSLVVKQNKFSIKEFLVP